MGSAATFYAPAKDRSIKAPKEEGAEGATSDADSGDKGPSSPCPGVDQVNALLRLGKQQLGDPSSKCKFKAIVGSEVAGRAYCDCECMCAVAHVGTQWHAQ